MLANDHEGELIAEMPYTDIQCMFDDPPEYRNHWSGTSLKAMPDEAVDLICEGANDVIVPSVSVYLIFPQGGAVGRGPAHYAVPWRDAPWVVHPFAQWQDTSDDERARRWTLDVDSRLQPWSSHPVSLNYVGDEGQDRMLSSVRRDNYARLSKVKVKFDPKNVFNRNHNIKPIA